MAKKKRNVEKRQKKKESTPESSRAQTSGSGTLPENATQEEILAYYARQYEGPIPPPEMLANYNAVHPGLGDTIIQNWREESQHRRKMQRRAMSGLSRGQYLGFTLLAGIMALCAYALYLGEVTTAMVWFFVYVVIVIGAIVTNTRKE